MIDFIVGNKDIVFSTVVVLLAAVSFIVTFIRTGSIKKSINNFIEVDKLKYRTIESEKPAPQEFSEEVKDYILNPATNELEELPVPKNIQDYINSHIDTCLERALERFLPNVQSEDDVYADYTERVDDLAHLADMIDLAEEYRERLGMSDSASIADIYAAVDRSAKDLKAKLSVKKEDSVSGESKEKNVE